MHWRRDERSVEEYVKINLIIERHLKQLESQVSTSKLQFPAKERGLTYPVLNGLFPDNEAQIKKYNWTSLWYKVL